MRISAHTKGFAHIFITLFLLLLAGGRSEAQKVVTLNGKYSYIVGLNDNITIREATIKSIEMAKVEALKNEFGTIVSSDLISSDRVVNDEFSSIFMAETSTSVKGEWLGDDREPQVSVEFIDGELVFTAEVWGKGREIVRAATDLKWQVQKDINGKKIEADNFATGERFFVSFKSPADGYVAIYLISEDSETACLLPYRTDKTGRFPIKGGKDYVFFDKSVDVNASYYKLSTSKPQEYNQLVIIYSPNPFMKCTDVGRDSRHPNALDSKDFAKWLLKSQRDDRDMVVNRKWVSISGPTE